MYKNDSNQPVAQQYSICEQRSSDVSATNQSLVYNPLSECYNTTIIKPKPLIGDSWINQTCQSLDTLCSNEQQLKKVKQNGWELIRMEQTPELCLEAVKKDNYVLQIIQPTLPNYVSICFEAVRQDGSTLRFVKMTSDVIQNYFQLCLEAVRQCGTALQFVLHQELMSYCEATIYVETINQYITGSFAEHSSAIIKKAVKKCYFKLCLEAIKQNVNAFQYVLYQSYNLCLQAIRINFCVLCYIRRQTIEYCLEAVRQNGFALLFIEKQTPEICMLAVHQNGYALQLVAHQTKEICIVAVRQNGLALQFVHHQTLPICLEAVVQNRASIQFAEKQLADIIKIILEIS